MRSILPFLCGVLCACWIDNSVTWLGIPIAEPPERADAAVEFITDTYIIIYENLRARPTVWWVDTPCGPTGEVGIEWEGRCYHGLAFACLEIYVAIAPEQSLADTELCHELGHCYHWALSDPHDGDGAHANVDWWLFNQQVQADLAVWEYAQRLVE